MSNTKDIVNIAAETAQTLAAAVAAALLVFEMIKKKESIPKVLLHVNHPV